MQYKKYNIENALCIPGPDVMTEKSRVDAKIGWMLIVNNRVSHISKADEDRSHVICSYPKSKTKQNK